MTKINLLCATALCSVALSANPALAQTATGAPVDSQTPPSQQTATPAAQSDDADLDSQTVVVTGSRIRRPNLDSPVPVTSVSGEEFFETGRTSIGDTLNELPSLRSTFSQSNSTRFLGTAGLNLLDLRGLGTQRTLVLVNGRRHVAGDILNTASSTDVNTIPTDLIDSVDVVTGGDSAVYGSDAIAGVVNFKLKDHYSGVQLRAQGGISSHGDAGNYYISGLAGKNFADGRGNIALNLEYAHQEDFYAPDRAFYRQNNAFVTVDSDPAGSPNGSDGVPDRQFFRDIRSGTYSNAGTFVGCCDVGAAGQTIGIPYIFQPDGTLARQTGTPIGNAFFSSYQGGNGDNFRDGTQFGLQPKLDRYSANLIGHFEVSPAFVPFVEGTYTRTDSLGSASGPFFTGSSGSPREGFFTDNPYLTDQARSILLQQDSYDANCAYGSDGVPDALRGQCGVKIFKNAVDLSNRVETARRETYRAVLGVRGELSSHLNYEISGNYGEFHEKTALLGNVNLQRYLLSIDAVDQGQYTTGVANGNVVCRASIDPAARVAFEGAANSDFAASQLAADVAACVPVNLFGSGKITDAARNYLVQNSYARGKITQFVLSGFVSGDTGAFLNLPGGPVGFALGGEYRRETAYYRQDDVTAAGLTFYNAIPTFDPPSFAVKELYGELRVPILKDVPFFQELTVSGAARVADYKGSTGTVYSYNGALEWSPVRSLRFRGNYSRAVRAPNLSDSYTPLGQNYSLVNDPCSARFIGEGTSNRAANCAADGVPAGFDYEYTSSLAFLSGGNPNLNAEKSDSYTVGGVFQPTFVPGFSLSVDYYKITVNKVITAPDAQDILDACYDAASIDNQFCALFQRNTGPGAGPRGEEVGRILENSLQVVPLNYAKLKVSGLDIDVGYDHQIGNIGKLSLHGVWTLALQNSSYLNPTDPGREDRILSELGDPRNQFNINGSLKTGPITFGYKLRYIGPQVPNLYEDTHSLQGRPPQNEDAYPIRYYSAVWYHDARIGIDATDKFNLYLGVDNLTNKMPPYYLTGIGGGSSIYNNVGRFLYAGVVAKF